MSFSHPTSKDWAILIICFVCAVVIVILAVIFKYYIFKDLSTNGGGSSTGTGGDPPPPNPFDCTNFDSYTSKNLPARSGIHTEWGWFSGANFGTEDIFLSSFHDGDNAPILEIYKWNESDRFDVISTFTTHDLPDEIQASGAELSPVASLNEFYFVLTYVNPSGCGVVVRRADPPGSPVYDGRIFNMTVNNMSPGLVLADPDSHLDFICVFVDEFTQNRFALILEHDPIQLEWSLRNFGHRNVWAIQPTPDLLFILTYIDITNSSTLTLYQYSRDIFGRWSSAYASEKAVWTSPAVDLVSQNFDEGFGVSSDGLTLFFADTRRTVGSAVDAGVVIMAKRDSTSSVFTSISRIISQVPVSVASSRFGSGAITVVQATNSVHITGNNDNGQTGAVFQFSLDSGNYIQKSNGLPNAGSDPFNRIPIVTRVENGGYNVIYLQSNPTIPGDFHVLTANCAES